ncbi:scamp-domain-containing protein [Histomonas meleagridis]|uniref:scamp-domain-containing protein n=1 Tax=Histomonas meleagridis TaxID=135588 RepID=UPI0035595FD9|nr:scamp-domain-containing protein [Histomonas meleagridis]KAH0803782.1 scamp-domain-containing protein [Histomonas meleagridis]
MSDNNPLDAYSPFEEDAEIKEERPNTKFTTIGADPIIDENDDEEIRAYEQRLNILEAQLNSQATQLSIAQETGTFEEPPNFPKFYPLVHFDIEEVPLELRQYVNNALFSWCVMFISFALNWLSCLFLLGAGEATDSPGSKIALSTLYFFLVVPMAIDFDALTIYNTLKNSSPTTIAYMKIFLFLGITILFEGILTLGLESSGSCGLITMISLFVSGHPVIGIFSLLVTLGLGAATYLHFRLFMSLWSYYKGTEQGADIQNDMKRTLTNIVVDALQKK